MARMRRAGSAGIVCLALAMIVGLYLDFVDSPPEALMGNVVRIMYFHIASAVDAFLAFASRLCLACGSWRQSRMKWDRMAAASAGIAKPGVPDSGAGTVPDLSTAARAASMGLRRPGRCTDWIGREAGGLYAGTGAADSDRTESQVPVPVQTETAQTANGCLSVPENRNP